jgi:hypothetical protein
MSKRSRRLGKKNELQAVEEAIGASLGKRKAKVEDEFQGMGRKVQGTEIGREGTKGSPTEPKTESR